MPNSSEKPAQIETAQCSWTFSENGAIAWYAFGLFTQPCIVSSSSIRNYSSTRRHSCPKMSVSQIRLWPTSSSVLHLDQTHPGVLSTMSIRRVTCIYCKNAYTRLSLFSLTIVHSNWGTVAALRPPPSSSRPKAGRRQFLFDQNRRTCVSQIHSELFFNVLLAFLWISFRNQHLVLSKCIHPFANRVSQTLPGILYSKHSYRTP